MLFPAPLHGSAHVLHRIRPIPRLALEVVDQAAELCDPGPRPVLLAVLELPGFSKDCPREARDRSLGRGAVVVGHHLLLQLGGCAPVPVGEDEALELDGGGVLVADGFA